MKQVFVDVDTQVDFLYPTGALAVPGATEILPHLAALTQFAAKNGIPLLSSADAHLENDEEFAQCAAHCVAGTLGAAKVPETLLAKHTRIGVDEAFSGEVNGQVILEKRSVDMFTQPSIAKLLASLAPERFVVYGVVTEICVMHAVNGLLRLGKPVALVSDAVFALEESRARGLLHQWQFDGCAIVKTAEIIS